jgi:hypothetical protein
VIAVNKRIPGMKWMLINEFNALRVYKLNYFMMLIKMYISNETSIMRKSGVKALRVAKVYFSNF